jgi:hypothetical protein
VDKAGAVAAAGPAAAAAERKGAGMSALVLSVINRLYRLGLRLYPASFRAEFAGEMAAVLADRLEDAAARGRAGVIALAAHELGGLLGQAARERLYALRERPGHVTQTAGGPPVVIHTGWPVRLAGYALAVAAVAGLAVLVLPVAIQLIWSHYENAPKVNDVALADLNGDGHPDAFLAVGRGNMPFPAYALYNDGAGRLGGETQATRPWPGFSAALGDLNADGRVDALLDISGGGIQLFLNQPYGLKEERDFLTEPGPKGVMRLRPVVGDLNGDGRLDVFAAGCCGRPPGESPDTIANAYQPPYSQVWLQTADGRLRASQRVGEAPSHAAALADLDGDGHMDVFLANGRLLEAGWESGPPQPNTVWFNDGQGSFHDSGQRLGQAESTAVALGDVNGDGAADAVVGTQGAGEVWLNDGRGFFTDSGQRLGSGLTEYVFLADLDGDGDSDLLAAGETEARAWFNDGQGQFQPGRQRLGYSADDAAALGDLNGDGLADVLVAGVRTARVWANDGRGEFTAGPRIRYK